MEKWLDEWLPIFGVEHDCILSKQGDVTIAYKVNLPEIFTLSTEDYDNLHHAWIRGLKTLPKHTVFHKQDWFLQKKYVPPLTGNTPSYLNKASAKHFAGRLFLDHSCYLFLTKKADGRKISTSLFSNIIRKSIVPELTLKEEFLTDFQDICGQFKQIIEATGLVRLNRLKGEELMSQRRSLGVVEQYCSLSEKADEFLMKDISTEGGLHIGDKQCMLFSLGDAIDLPHLCGSRLTYDKYSTDRTKFSIGFATPLGLLLPCNHLYNQFIFIDDGQQTINQMEKKRLRLQSLSAYSRENAIARDATNDFLNEAIGEQRLPVKAHFNVMLWSRDDKELKELKNLASASFAQMDAAAKEETVGAPQIYWAGIPGNSADFPMNDSFDTFAEQASCFLNAETNYRSAPPESGIRFCDRISGKPVYIDMFDEPRKIGWTSNMGLLCAGSSGGGKSMTVNHILRSLYDQGAHCLIVDIGGSYRALCELFNGYYFTYDEKSPISFNPFYLADGMTLDTEKKESLKSLLVALWKQENESFYRAEYVALSNALQGYYSKLAKNEDIFPCFNTFYEYLEGEYRDILITHRVKDKDFDVDNFLYVLRPYYKGNEFDFLLNATENLDLLNQQFTVYELDNLKDHNILFSVVTLILVESFVSKMRKLKGIRKVLIIDEAWKAITKSGMAEFLKYAFKTIRKYNGIPGVITQELDDLVSSEIIKDAIINNADIKILLSMKKFMNKFDKLQTTLGMSDKAKSILLSVNQDEREVFIDLGGQHCKVFKNELSPHEYFAFTTDGKERVKVLEYAERYGSMEAGIDELVKERA
ncbi:TraG family conjugative transposon ATPase [Olivibacter domesticus]|uniref:Bacteroides conjugation system ATPase, TraG family n=1 Tax=Olivibacter domesticus TaxID=407022 RepID=A0A1H7IBU9_OLID1|nr:TraG family conjugative transposon ATPase [Olivibacter domesticus]SEK59000.1 Bacteroides conjugation system ATPase, TraG family [Olivibacter domesticus]